MSLKSGQLKVLKPNVQITEYACGNLVPDFVAHLIATIRKLQGKQCDKIMKIILKFLSDHCGYQCNPVNTAELLSKIENSMASAQGVAVKTVRLHDLKALEPLLLQESIDLKILVLIRDPRAVLASRLELAQMQASKGGWTLDASRFKLNSQT